MYCYLLITIYYHEVFKRRTLEMDQKQAQLDLLYFCISAKTTRARTHRQWMVIFHLLKVFMG